MISNFFKFCWHDYEEIKTQMTKRIGFGIGNCPGLRVIEKCRKCEKINYVSLNLSMPKEYLYKEHIWS